MDPFSVDVSGIAEVPEVCMRGERTSCGWSSATRLSTTASALFMIMASCI